MANHDEAGSEFRLGSRMFVGFFLALLLLLGFGGWAAMAQISGAIIAQGMIKVDRNLKTIQHRDGGIISEIAVREGDFVQAGQVILRLDDVQTRAELSIVRSQLAELAARRARLIAERDGLTFIPISSAAPFAVSLEQLQTYGEVRMFNGNRVNRESQKEQLRFEIQQLGEEIKGLQAQQGAKAHEVKLVSAEHDKVKGLADKMLIERSRLYASDRDLARLLGEQGELDASIARARARTSSVNLQIIAIDETARTDAQRELSEVETKLSESNDRRIAIEDRLSRTDIRAPLAGTVNELAVNTIGGVITPAATLAIIVPENATLKVEAKLSPADIDQVFVGQPVNLRFSAFHQRTTPELKGKVIYVSAATTRDPTTNEVHYVADVQVDPGEMEKLGRQVLMPGMPVEVFVSTEERNAISYLSKPFTDQFTKAFREE